MVENACETVAVSAHSDGLDLMLSSLLALTKLESWLIIALSPAFMAELSEIPAALRSHMDAIQNVK